MCGWPEVVEFHPEDRLVFACTTDEPYTYWMTKTGDYYDFSIHNDGSINIAIGEIEKDDQSYDSLKDKWSDNTEKFEKISLDNNQNEFASI